MLCDNLADPGQLNNLTGNPGSNELQDKMSRLLKKKLKEVDDADFKPKQYYLEKWSLRPGAGGSIPYTSVPGKENIVQTPKRGNGFW